MISNAIASVCVQQNPKDRVRQLLENPTIRDEIILENERRKLTAERFDMFEALGLSTKENYHSRFIAYLLNPKERHDQGAVFLLPFIELIRSRLTSENIIRPLTESDWKAVTVRTEVYANQFGRIDLVIELPGKATIAIENKVYATERDDQLSDYWGWLRQRCNNNQKKPVLVFLTPEGRKPQSAGKADLVLTISYTDLAECLDIGLQSCSSTAADFISTIHKYASLCRQLFRKEKSVPEYNKEIIGLLNNPTNLQTALEIEFHLNKLKSSIQELFRDGVMNALRARLAADKQATQHFWEVGVIPNTPELLFGIKKKYHNKGSLVTNYCCAVCTEFGPRSVYGGWRRPSGKDVKTHYEPIDSEALEKYMNEEGFGHPEYWWVSVTDLRDEFPELAAWGADQIYAIHADNEDKDHPLANKLADWMWHCFIGYRDKVAQLDSYNALDMLGAENDNHITTHYALCVPQ